MRKTLGICVALVALVAGIGVFAPGRHAPETAGAGSSVVPASFPAAVPQAEAASEAPPPAAPAADLPSIEVQPHIVHAVPDDGDTLPAPPTTFHELVERSVPAPAPRSRATNVAINPGTLAGTARPGGG